MQYEKYLLKINIVSILLKTKEELVLVPAPSLNR